MRQSNTRTVVEQKPLGVIDSLTAGLDLVRRRPWTMLIPILIDLLIWVLPRLSLTQLIRPGMDQMLSMAVATGDPETVDQLRQTAEQLISSINLMSLVTTTLNGITRFPSLFEIDTMRASLVNVPGPINALAFTQPILSPEFAVLLFVPLFMLGLLLVAVYLEAIAQGVRPLETRAPGTTPLRIAHLWVRLILFALLLAVLLFAAVIVSGLLQMFFASPEMAAFVTLLLTIGLFWVFIYFFFAVSSMAVNDVGVRLAIRRSTLLFRIFFWSTIGLVLLSVFLQSGLGIIWEGLTVSTLGVIIAIVANAYIGTSLLAAAMVYYQDRMNLFERWRQAAKTTKK